jgi:hypothetical protein
MVVTANIPTVVGRLYEIVVQASGYNPVGTAANVYYTLTRDGANGITLAQNNALAALVYLGFGASRLFVGDGATHSWQLQAVVANVASTSWRFLVNSCTIIAKDIGPS